MVVKSLSACLFLGLALVVRSEEWKRISSHVFNIEESALRRQGIAADNMGKFWYSSFQSLILTPSLNASADVFNINAIPFEMKKMYNSDHIGDIDYADKKLYIPLEDGSDFKNPYVLVYDALTLALESSHPLLQSEQIDGVPWLCVDGSSRRLFTSHYSNVSEINVYSLDTFDFIGHIQMSESLDSIQGAAFYKNALYLTASSKVVSKESVFSVFRMDLTDGSITVACSIDDTYREIEGICITENYDDGLPRMDVVAIRDIDNELLNTLKVRIAEVLSFGKSA